MTLCYHSLLSRVLMSTNIWRSRVVIHDCGCGSYHSLLSRVLMSTNFLSCSSSKDTNRYHSLLSRVLMSTVWQGTLCCPPCLVTIPFYHGCLCQHVGDIHSIMPLNVVTIPFYHGCLCQPYVFFL